MEYKRLIILGTYVLFLVYVPMITDTKKSMVNFLKITSQKKNRINPPLYEFGDLYRL